MTAGAALRIDHPAPAVVRILLDRSGRRNAIDGALVAAMLDEFSALAAPRAGQTETRAVVLGSIDASIFCAGADLTLDDDDRATVSDNLYALYEQMVTLPMPIIAVVEGPAIGGGAQLAVAADVRVAGPGGRFRFPGTGHGVAVGGWALPGLIGRGRALDICLSRRWIEAPEAEQIGLASAVVDAPMEWAVTLAERIAASDEGAVRRIKALANDDSVIGRLRAERAGNRADWSGSVIGLSKQEPPGDS